MSELGALLLYKGIRLFVDVLSAIVRLVDRMSASQEWTAFLASLLCNLQDSIGSLLSQN
jgi:hypothetical protein